MASYGELQVAEFLGEAKHASAGSDASNKGNVEVHSLCVSRERTQEQINNKEKSTTLFCGHIPKGGKKAEHAAAAVEGKLAEIGETAAALGREDLKEHTSTLKFSKAKGGEGWMADHQTGENAMCDVIEQQNYKLLMTTEIVPGFRRMPVWQRQQLCRMARDFCFEHKADNLCKEARKGLFDWAVQQGDIDPKNKEHQFATGFVYAWNVHKAFGRPCGKKMTGADRCNMHADFMAWLRERELTFEIKWVRDLGPIVGDRFWAVFKNATLIYALRPCFLHDEGPGGDGDAT
mmetsp:Transcript_28073/g.57514  ORF Transcript_28073/g.57514 Transcript_28073/m.57514 type:complete len:290 (+) Transcript_28073:522-1391(+)